MFCSAQGGKTRTKVLTIIQIQANKQLKPSAQWPGRDLVNINLLVKRNLIEIWWNLRYTFLFNIT